LKSKQITFSRGNQPSLDATTLIVTSDLIRRTLQYTNRTTVQISKATRVKIFNGCVQSVRTNSSGYSRFPKNQGLKYLMVSNQVLQRWLEKETGCLNVH